MQKSPYMPGLFLLFIAPTIYHTRCLARRAFSLDRFSGTSSLRTRLINSRMCPTYKTEAPNFQSTIITADAFRKSAGHARNLITADFPLLVAAAAPFP